MLLSNLFLLRDGKHFKPCPQKKTLVPLELLTSAPVRFIWWSPGLHLGDEMQSEIGTLSKNTTQY